jgi:hypothetical protein
MNDIGMSSHDADTKPQVQGDAYEMKKNHHIMKPHGMIP